MHCGTIIQSYLIKISWRSCGSSHQKTSWILSWWDRDEPPVVPITSTTSSGARHQAEYIARLQAVPVFDSSPPRSRFSKMAPKDNDDFGIPHTRVEPRPDFSKPVPSKKLPEAIQKVLDDDEKFWEVLDDKK